MFCDIIAVRYASAFHRKNTKEENGVMHEKNRFLYSPFVIILLGILSFAAFAFSKELAFYSLVVAYALYVIAFSEDLSPIMPLFLLCYIAPSVSNNPGKSEDGVFYGESGLIMLALVSAVVIALLLRIIFDANIGWRQFFKKPRMLLGGMLALGAVYLLSGIGSRGYIEDAKRNFVFALIQFASVILLYYIFSATVDWERFDIDYFAWSGLVPGFVVLAELVWVYLTQDIWLDGAVNRDAIYTGWGINHNMGAIMVTSIPFAFYFAGKKKHNSVYLILACILFIGVLLSCSRSSVLFAAIVMFLSYIYTFVKTENKKEFGITSAFLAVLLVACGMMLWEKMMVVFGDIPSIADSVDGEITFNTSGRFRIYKAAYERFLRNPILGQGFYSRDYVFNEFSTVEKFSSFFPPRMHNTIIQILFTCGVVGLVAYLYHRGQTICLFVRRWSVERAYIAIYMMALLGMSLLDCHFFNVGPTLFYSIALAVAEFGEDECY